jgi:nitrite reductase/ring-hydroxylating ferredoxin subunit/uncharacterized membrane protein
MKSKAHFKAHPLHPALIPFPFAFLFGATLFDLLATALDKPAFWTTAGHLTLAGIAAGLLAAVPGAIDYVYAVPPNSSGKKRATKHAALNVATLILFAIAWALRAEDGAPSGMTLALEVTGAIALSYAGLLGGTLVIRNMVSVDHRYAGAGKWNEESFTTSGDEDLAVADADELEEDQMKLLHVNGRRIALARTSTGYTAFEDGCTHRGGSLAGGVMIDGTVQCLWHGSQFDSKTGKVMCGPAKKQIRVYEVKQVNKKILLVSSPRGR